MMALLSIRWLLTAAILLVLLSGCGVLPEVPVPHYPYPIPNQGGR